MTPKDFKLPDLGEGVHEGRILRMMVKPGEVVREDQPLLEVETDKAAVVIPCPFSGTVQAVHVSDGQLVHVGDVMVTIGDGAAGSRGAARSYGPATSVAGKRDESISKTSVLAKPAPDSSSATHATRATPQAAERPNQHHKPASPAVRKLARSMGLDIEVITGSGPGGRVQRQDLEMATAGAMSPSPGREMRGTGASHPPHKTFDSFDRVSHAPATSLIAKANIAQPSPAVAARVAHNPLPESMIVEPQGDGASDAWGRVVKAPLSQARKTIAQVMTQSWTTIPHATDFDDADVTELEKLRKGYSSPEAPDRKITMLAFVVRAVVRALQRFPEFNAHVEIDRNETIYKRYINIAIGTHTARGLVPMVLRDADRLTIPQISDALAAIAEKARTATFAVNDTKGGTYTISNAGAMGGSRYSTPIITPGQAAVLAVGRTRWMPWVLDGEPQQPKAIAPRLIMPLSHSIDHRLLDGGQEIAFMQHIIGDLQNPARLLL